LLKKPSPRSLPRTEEPTMSTLMIPPAVVPRLREGVLAHLETLGDRIAGATWYQEKCEALFEQVEEQWALLDVIGWSVEEDTGEMIEADIAPVGKAMKFVADDMTVSMVRWFGEMDENEPERPARAEELRLMQQFRVQVRRARKGRRGR
jgi:hypothetical protein